MNIRKQDDIQEELTQEEEKLGSESLTLEEFKKKYNTILKEKVLEYLEKYPVDREKLGLQSKEKFQEFLKTNVVPNVQNSVIQKYKVKIVKEEKPMKEEVLEGFQEDTSKYKKIIREEIGDEEKEIKEKMKMGNITYSTVPLSQLQKEKKMFIEEREKYYEEMRLQSDLRVQQMLENMWTHKKKVEGDTKEDVYQMVGEQVGKGKINLVDYGLGKGEVEVDFKVPSDKKVEERIKEYWGKTLINDDMKSLWGVLDMNTLAQYYIEGSGGITIRAWNQMARIDKEAYNVLAKRGTNTVKEFLDKNVRILPIKHEYTYDNKLTNSSLKANLEYYKIKVLSAGKIGEGSQHNLLLQPKLQKPCECIIAEDDFNELAISDDIILQMSRYVKNPKYLNLVLNLDYPDIMSNIRYHPSYMPKYKIMGPDLNMFYYFNRFLMKIKKRIEMSVENKDLKMVDAYNVLEKELYELKMVADNHYFGRAGISGQLGRWSACNKIHELKKEYETNGSIPGKQYDDFKKWMKKYYPAVKTEFQFSGNRIAKMDSLSFKITGHPMVRINLQSGAGIVWVNKKRTEVVIQDFLLVQELLFDLEKYDKEKDVFWRKWNFVFLAKMKPKEEVYKIIQMNDKIRNYWEFNSFIFIPMQCIFSKIFQSYVTFEMGGHSMLGWSPVKGGMNSLVMWLKKCSQIKDEMVWILVYCDNLYVLQREKEKYMFYSLDGKKMEASHSEESMKQFAEYIKKLVKNKDDAWRNYIDFYATVITNYVSVIGSKQIKGIGMPSGIMGTGYCNHFKMESILFMLNKYWRIQPNLLIVDGKIEQGAEKVIHKMACELSIEKIVDVTDLIMDKSENGKIYEMDLLGCSGVYMKFKDYGELVSCLDLDRLRKALCFNKLDFKEVKDQNEDDLLNKNILNYGRLATLFVVGAYAYQGLDVATRSYTSYMLTQISETSEYDIDLEKFLDSIFEQTLVGGLADRYAQDLQNIVFTGVPPALYDCININGTERLLKYFVEFVKEIPPLDLDKYISPLTAIELGFSKTIIGALLANSVYKDLTIKNLLTEYGMVDVYNEVSKFKKFKMTSKYYLPKELNEDDLYDTGIYRPEIRVGIQEEWIDAAEDLYDGLQNGKMKLAVSAPAFVDKVFIISFLSLLWKITIKDIKYKLGIEKKKAILSVFSFIKMSWIESTSLVPYVKRFIKQYRDENHSNYKGFKESQQAFNDIYKRNEEFKYLVDKYSSKEHIVVIGNETNKMFSYIRDVELAGGQKQTTKVLTDVHSFEKVSTVETEILTTNYVYDKLVTEIKFIEDLLKKSVDDKVNRVLEDNLIMKKKELEGMKKMIKARPKFDIINVSKEKVIEKIKEEKEEKVGGEVIGGESLKDDVMLLVKKRDEERRRNSPTMEIEEQLLKYMSGKLEDKDMAVDTKKRIEEENLSIEAIKKVVGNKDLAQKMLDDKIYILKMTHGTGIITQLFYHIFLKSKLNLRLEKIGSNANFSTRVMKDISETFETQAGRLSEEKIRKILKGLITRYIAYGGNINMLTDYVQKINNIMKEGEDYELIGNINDRAKDVAVFLNTYITIPYLKFLV